jgi:enoyl-CoA hydratase/carnithine racemase
MMPEPVQYDLRDKVATIRIDDGKRNALSPEVLARLYKALERAEGPRTRLSLPGRRRL